MSEAQHADARTEHEQINGIDKLHARPLGGHQYVVLSTRNDGVTAHKVDIGQLDCPCTDQDMNKEGAGVCDHLAVAILQAPDALEWNSMAANDMANYLGRLEGIVGRLEHAGNQTAAGATTSAGSGGSDSGGDSEGENDSDDFWTEYSPDNTDLYDDVTERLEQMFSLQPGINEGSVEIHPAKIDGSATGVVLEFAAPWDHQSKAWDSSAGSWESDDAKESYHTEQQKFRDYCKGLDPVEYEGEPHYVNYIKEQRFGEVLA